MEINSLSSTQVSDLFFNFEKPNLTGYFNATEDPDSYSKEARAELLEDARMFSEIVGGQVTAEELAEDYLRRL